MSEVGYLAALVLGALFAWAGAAKLLGRPRTVRTFRQLGLPAPSQLSVAVPMLELGLAVALVIAPRPAGGIALVTLLVFSTVLLRALRSGVAVGCGCFGSASTSPVSAMTLLRNGFLATAALMALAGRPSMPGLPALVVVGTALAIAGLVLAVAELKQITGHVWAMELPTQ